MPEQIYDERPSTPGGEPRDRITSRLYPEPQPTLARPAAPQRNRLLAFVLIGLGLSMLLGQAGRLPFSGHERGESSRSYPLRGVTAAVVDVGWGSGRLGIRSESGKDLVRSVVHGGSIDSDVDYDGEQAEITVRDEPERWFFGRRGGSSGEILLNPEPEYQLSVDAGSGAVSLGLADLRLETLDLEVGSSNVDVRLPMQDADGLEGRIEVGSGSLRIHLPADMPTRVVIDNGSGTFKFFAGTRLRQVEGDGIDGVFQTPDFDPDQEHIQLEIESGSGAVVIE